MRHFTEALRLVQRLNEAPQSEDTRALRGVLGATRLDGAVLSSVAGHVVLLYI